MFALVQNAVKHDQEKLGPTLPVPGARRLVTQRSVKSIKSNNESISGAFTAQGVPLNIEILENPYERGYTYQDIINLRRQFEIHSQVTMSVLIICLLNRVCMRVRNLMLR